MAEGGGDGDLAAPVAPRMGRLGRVLHQVEEHLDQLVFLGEGRRQGRIIGFADDQAVGDAAGGRRPDPVEHAMDIDRPADGLQIEGEGLHAVD